MSEEKSLEEQYNAIEATKNILAGQEGLIRRPVFDGKFGKDQKFKGYEIEAVRVKSVYAKEDQLWAKFEPLQGGDGFNVRIDNAYQQFRNTKEMTPEEIRKAEWMKARNKLDSPAFVQKLIHQGKTVDALMKVGGYMKEHYQENDLGSVAKSEMKSIKAKAREAERTVHRKSEKSQGQELSR